MFKTRAGFSLLEFIIYIAIIGGLSTFVAGAFIIANRGGSIAQARYAVNSNMRVALDSITQDIKNADYVATPVLTVSSSTLVLQVGPDEVTYDVSGGRLRRNGLNITSESVVVSSPVFRLFVNLNTPTLDDSININSTLTIAYNSSSPDYAFSETLSKTVLLEPTSLWPGRGNFGAHVPPPPGGCGGLLGCSNIPCVNSLPDSKQYARLFDWANRAHASVSQDPCSGRDDYLIQPITLE
jgi:type II secretory pathway pseudopilin PulG